MRAMTAAVLLAGTMLAWQRPAAASDKPVYQPAPGWVIAAPPIDATKLTDDAPVLLRLDQQDRLADGTVWSYRDTATRLATPEVVQQAGTLTVAWQPDKGDLIVHAAEIIRGAEHIDLLAGGRKFEVLRREQQLEQFQLTGMLTATMPVEGLRVGDVLRLAVSETNSEPVLKGGMATGEAVPAAPFKVGFTRTRLLWPASAPVRWRSYADGATPQESKAGATHEVVLTGALLKPADLPADAPVRFRKLPVIEASSFADWNGLSALMAPLYATDGLLKPGGALDGEVAKIAAASSDPLQRTAAALQLVQENVRYLAVGLNQGNLMPQPPEQTWTLRYGDCKAKTLLLLTVLHKLGITAEPVLASSQLGDLLPARLPGPAAFDHILVRATVGGDVLWLDGTMTGSRFANLHDAPPLKWVLPVRAGGAGLMAVPARAPGLPALSVDLDYDQRAGINLPAKLHAVATLRGAIAAPIGLAKTQGSREQQEDAIGGFLRKFVGRDIALSAVKLDYDPLKAVATVDATGIVGSGWQRRDARYRIVLDQSVSDLSFAPDRARPAWQAIPVATDPPFAMEIRTSLRLPAGLTTVTLDGDATLDGPIGPIVVKRVARLDGTTITADETRLTSGAEIAPADLPAARARVALAKTRLLEAVAPIDLPSRLSMVERDKRDGSLKPLLDVYAATIAAHPDRAYTYANRAYFQQGLYDWRAALADYDKAIALEPTPTLYLARAYAYRVTGQPDKAAADAEAARQIEPASYGALYTLGMIDVDRDKRDAAVSRVQEQIDAGGDQKAAMMGLKADLLAHAGDRDGAVAALDQAIALRPGNTDLLNQRCWIKAELNVALDSALKDCTKSIDLSDSPIGALDSRALVYYRLGRLDDAMTDLAAVFEINPDQASSLYLRGLIAGKRGDAAAAKRDLAAAQTLDPLIIGERKRFGLAPPG